MRRPAVQLGDRFVTAKTFRGAWEVEHVFNDPSGIPHARLFNVNSPRDKRTVALSILAEGREYLRAQ